MNSYYSKNKKDLNDELTKIEQKKYEDLLFQERMNRKTGISSRKNSVLDENKYKRLSDSTQESEKFTRKPSFKPIKETIDSVNIENPKESQNPNFNLLDKNISQPVALTPGILKLPKINKARDVKKTSENDSKTSIEKMKQELNFLEEEEAILEASLQKLDIQVYKKKIAASLQTIDEETKEIEDTLINNQDKLLEINKNTGMLKTILERSEASEFQNTHEFVPTAFKKELESIDENVSVVTGNDKKSVGKTSKCPNTPDNVSFQSKSRYKIPIRSIYSEKSSKKRKNYSSNAKFENFPRPRIVSRDRVKVNPSINIRELLFS